MKIIEQQDINWMQHAINLAKQAALHNEVPVGAVLVLNNQIIGKGFNQPIKNNDPTAHAEIIALRQGADNLNNYRLLDTTLYITLEPCAMCAGAIIHSRVKRVVYGAFDPRAGGAGSVFSILQSDKLNHKVEICSDVMSKECGDILREFFKERRK
jgi:tRNA(adenine34) deaminase